MTSERMMTSGSDVTLSVLKYGHQLHELCVTAAASPADCVGAPSNQWPNYSNRLPDVVVVLAAACASQCLYFSSQLENLIKYTVPSL